MITQQPIHATEVSHLLELAQAMHLVQSLRLSEPHLYPAVDFPAATKRSTIRHKAKINRDKIED